MRIPSLLPNNSNSHPSESHCYADELLESGSANIDKFYCGHSGELCSFRPSIRRPLPSHCRLPRFKQYLAVLDGKESRLVEGIREALSDKHVRADMDRKMKEALYMSCLVEKFFT